VDVRGDGNVNVKAAVLGSLVALAGCARETPPTSEGDETSDTDPGPGIGLDGTADGTVGGNDGDDGEKLDLGDNNDTNNAGDCMSGSGMSETSFSYIWIANSPQGTVSKIDTATGIEHARYYTGPTNGLDDPSRTSVNLSGDVAVANRAGGLTKFAAEDVDCIDNNGNGMIDTSTGPTDVRPFGEDECMLWHVPLPYPENDNTQGPRPTAWDSGASQTPCQVADDRVWNGWWEHATGTAYFRRFEGITGAQLDEVVVPNYNPGQDWGYGPYGGAVDGSGNFWVSGLYGPLLRIDADSLMVDVWDMPAGSNAYGIAVDADGHPWTAGIDSGVLTHFDPATEMFEQFTTPNGSLRGVQIDREGQLWAAGNSPCGIIQFDLATQTVVTGNTIPLEGCGTPVGVSIDIEGNVWVPDQNANLAFKVDPQSYTFTTTTGLVNPYTYSDMTGSGLTLVTNPPQG